MDGYRSGDVFAFIGGPLLLMVPPYLLPFLAAALFWLACALDCIGSPLVRISGRR